MGHNNLNSDYGSGSSMNSIWLGHDLFQLGVQVGDSERPRAQRSASTILELAMGRSSLGDVMNDFSLNGFDSPYNPEDDIPQTDKLSGLGPGSAYLRQQSWPVPERTPAQRLPRPAPASDWIPSVSAKEFTSSMPANELSRREPVGPQKTEYITEEQLRVLSTLPDSVLYPLLRELENARGHGDVDRRAARRQPEECRFCRNNGERESYYRSHQLKDVAGRVVCPVLRAFVCRRCGARGDSAHTIKYCPLSTQEERMKSAAMMRSVRMASGRRRCAPAATSINKYFTLDDTPAPSHDTNVYTAYTPLDPVWAALEQKLML